MSLHFEIHYENLPMQYTEIFKVIKNENFHNKIVAIFSSPEPLGSQGELIGWP